MRGQEDCGEYGAVIGLRAARDRYRVWLHQAFAKDGVRFVCVRNAFRSPNAFYVLPMVSLFALAAVLGGCSQPTPAVNPAASGSKATTPASTSEPLPPDIPIPADLEGRKDSALPGTRFHVVQGHVKATLPDTVAAIRKQAEDKGWKEAAEPPPADPTSVQTVIFEKGPQSLKVTLVKSQNTVTSVNILAGPKSGDPR